MMNRRVKLYEKDDLYYCDTTSIDRTLDYFVVETDVISRALYLYLTTTTNYRR